MNRFQDKNVIVTGGAGGIGDAICRRFAAEGAQVWIVDSNADSAYRLAEEILSTGGRARWRKVDLASSLDIFAFVAMLREQEERIDVLINNAGINRRGPLLELSDEDWQATFTVNLDALFHMCRAVLPHMIVQGGGSIVNTASQWGLHPAPGHIAYNTSKAAVAAFTLNLARDYAPHNVRVNAVCPGEVRTPMLESNLARSGRSLDDLNALVPFGRIGEPEEIAATIAFLASDEAPYLCGALLEITGAQAVA
ncbi:SDR family NAD(P)-dependent oxidoreductase [Klebsiella pneumoniae]|uniref:SDR family NAD(P)-dependent oxidoreductase n=1 Tax=Klebsiella pneumoniae complex TaxID=3390273 RepID=UPI000C7D9B5B|nr:SDR family NAD(P)-dependent oxidoreductase [Klebsiella pneumoniae]PLO07777.1 short-chain dehydrogenase [Klebsiella pneumoniae]